VHLACSSLQSTSRRSVVINPATVAAAA
jgi:hypothetical protein